VATVGDVLRHVLASAGGLSEANRGELEEAISDFERMLEGLVPHPVAAPAPAPASPPPPPAPGG
jgi:hypothetical protein